MSGETRSLSPGAIERELKSRMTKQEFVLLQSRLTGALKAIAMLRERAPDLVPLMFGKDLDQARALPLHTQHALATLIEELLMAATTPDGRRLNRRLILKLVSRMESKQ